MLATSQKRLEEAIEKENKSNEMMTKAKEV
jgi:hypothetical protein